MGNMLTRSQSVNYRITVPLSCDFISQYHVTRHLTDLKKAFHSSSSMEQFISGMMNAIVSKQNYDDYRMTVALLASGTVSW